MLGMAECLRSISTILEWRGVPPVSKSIKFTKTISCKPPLVAPLAVQARQAPGASTNPRKSASPVVCPVKAGMFSREQTCRGRSQSPVVWIAEEMETEPSKPIDKTSRGEVRSHRAVTTVNALGPRKGVSPRAEPATVGRRQNDQPKTDRYGCSPRRGWKRQHGDKDMLSNWRNPPRPGEKSPEQGRPYNRQPREVGRRREGGGWVRTSRSFLLLNSVTR